MCVSDSVPVFPYIRKGNPGDMKALAAVPRSSFLAASLICVFEREPACASVLEPGSAHLHVFLHSRLNE